MPTLIEEAREKLEKWEASSGGKANEARTLEALQRACFKDDFAVLAAAAPRLVRALIDQLVQVQQERDERLPLGTSMQLQVRAEEAESQLAHLRAERATDERMRAAVAKVLETFERDEAQGYRSNDRQFAIAILKLAMQPDPPPI